MYSSESKETPWTNNSRPPSVSFSSSFLAAGYLTSFSDSSSSDSLFSLSSDSSDDEAAFLAGAFLAGASDESESDATGRFF